MHSPNAEVGSSYNEETLISSISNMHAPLWPASNHTSESPTSGGRTNENPAPTVPNAGISAQTPRHETRASGWGHPGSRDGLGQAPPFTIAHGLFLLNSVNSHHNTANPRSTQST